MYISNFPGQLLVDDVRFSVFRLVKRHCGTGMRCLPPSYPANRALCDGEFPGERPLTREACDVS